MPCEAVVCFLGRTLPTDLINVGFIEVKWSYSSFTSKDYHGKQISVI